MPALSAFGYMPVFFKIGIELLKRHSFYVFGNFVFDFPKNFDRIKVFGSVIFRFHFASLIKQRVHKFRFIEDLQLVFALADADIFHRDFELVGDAQHHAAFCRAI